jgi:hypothetical protein
MQQDNADNLTPQEMPTMATALAGKAIIQNMVRIHQRRDTSQIQRL